MEHEYEADANLEGVAALRSSDTHNLDAGTVREVWLEEGGGCVGSTVEKSASVTIPGFINSRNCLTCAFPHCMSSTRVVCRSA